jgi:hypothetical protein
MYDVRYAMYDIRYMMYDVRHVFILPGTSAVTDTEVLVIAEYTSANLPALSLSSRNLSLQVPMQALYLPT